MRATRSSSLAGSSHDAGTGSVRNLPFGSCVSSPSKPTSRGTPAGFFSPLFIPSFLIFFFCFLVSSFFFLLILVYFLFSFLAHLSEKPIGTQ